MYSASEVVPYVQVGIPNHKDQQLVVRQFHRLLAMNRVERRRAGCKMRRDHMEWILRDEYGEGLRPESSTMMSTHEDEVGAQAL